MRFTQLTCLTEAVEYAHDIREHYLTLFTCLLLVHQIPGCSKSGLFKAFSEYVIGQFGIEQKRNLKVHKCTAMRQSCMVRCWKITSMTIMFNCNVPVPSHFQFVFVVFLSPSTILFGDANYLMVQCNFFLQKLGGFCVMLIVPA